MTDEQLAELAPWSENSNLSKSHVNYSELLQLAKGWSDLYLTALIFGAYE